MSVPEPASVSALAAPVIAPVVIAPEPPLSVVAEPRVTVPRSIAAFVVLIVPFVVVVDGAVAVSPPANELVPPEAPMLSVPVLANVVAPPIVLLAPFKATL